ncbi:MAG: Spy/CpxP family protein refolding chaperone, partial [Pseudolabrys sp.]|nr:Spy/CpxP family protein refolding chaperone [Pseudolabrys sp.]
HVARPQGPAARPNIARPQAPTQMNRAARRAAQQQQRQQQLQQQRQNAARPDAAARTQALTPNARPQQSRAQQRAVARQERLERRREQRVLRNLPPQQRAARRQQFEQARQQRAAQRQQQLQQQARPNRPANAAAAVAAGANPQLRRNGQPRVTPQASRQGRFAAYWANRQAQANVGARADRFRARHERIAARRAWRQGHRANFVAWYGPVFWPYAYSDIFDYTFWPSGYDEGYWYYAYDDFFDGVYYGEYGPPEDYVGSIESAPRRASPPTYTAVQNLCRQPGNGITAWPIAEIESKVGLNAEQRKLLADVQNAGKQAADVFKQTCPSGNAYPLTPPGRLASMTARLDATLQAVETVRPPLETFYASLNDEQKERFNEIGPGKNVANNAEAREALPADARKCGENKPGLTNLPIEQIEDSVKPTGQQQAALDALGEATVKAVGVLQAACPSETPLTPPGRLEAIETRLKAMVNAANTVKQPLGDFYASLSAEQKARFNRMGRDLTVGQAN